MCRECCCGPPYEELEHGLARRFLSKAERAEKLKSCAEDLKKELSAVEEQIKELES